MNEHTTEVEESKSTKETVCPSNAPVRCIEVQSGIRAGLVQKFEGGDIEAD